MDGDPQIRRHGPMGSWDVSLIEDFSEVFSAERNPKMREFDEDLRLWNVARATNMRGMFRGCRSFNQNLSSWDTSSVTDMSYMFWNCESFNQDLSSWDTSSVTDMSGMF